NRQIEFRFSAPERDRELRLNPEVRRDVFLIYKEAVNNIVRHSECASAAIDLGVENGWLVLRVSDDGIGVDLARAGEGQGLANMRRGAESFGGRVDVVSPAAGGTTVLLSVPLERPLFKDARRTRAAGRQNGNSAR